MATRKANTSASRLAKANLALAQAKEHATAAAELADKEHADANESAAYWARAASEAKARKDEALALATS